MSMRSRAAVAVLVLIAACAPGPRPGEPPMPRRDGIAGLRELLRDSIPIEAPPGCFHLERPWTEYFCPVIIGSRYYIPRDSVVSSWLIIRTIDGRTHAMPVPTNADAIFMTRMAVDSLFVRYYRTIGQNAKADSLAAAARRLSRP